MSFLSYTIKLHRFTLYIRSKNNNSILRQKKTQSGATDNNKNVLTDSRKSLSWSLFLYSCCFGFIIFLINLLLILQSVLEKFLSFSLLTLSSFLDDEY